MLGRVILSLQNNRTTAAAQKREGLACLSEGRCDHLAGSWQGLAYPAIATVFGRPSFKGSSASIFGGLPGVKPADRMLAVRATLSLDPSANQEGDP